MSTAGTSEPASRADANTAEFIKQETVHREKWISLERITYKDPSGKVRTWEMVERTTKPQRVGVADAVAMVTILKRLLHYDCLILVRQFRPPLKCYTIEFPAGLIDNDEMPSEAAIRELKEETGYVGTVSSVSPVTAMDPGLSASTLNLVYMQIDGDEPFNQRPVSNPDEGEFIEVIQAPMHELLHKLNEYSNAGDFVDARVYTYAATLAQFQPQEGEEGTDLQKGLFRK
ncbi:ADP-sugar pyrophosphatase-like [Asterias rubens]|uniref:ADP-sugar pyrophosphatase-like n=1 Tax=Asterias rubens TaxID=7604 RepID=UPI0014551A4B|nr:ADP-sugar pyrophosphatase-like [Asterias rubens]XP_033647236.1 ADP-sugar pyrophosphatase-like [Asterias rubens]XP_033647237.1 ADP-sugar pyrophosphatase-like [Asterias rubens]